MRLALTSGPAGAMLLKISALACRPCATGSTAVASVSSPGREVDEAQVHRCGEEDFPATRLCQGLNVSPSGYFAWRSHPASPRPREDLGPREDPVVRAHIRSAFTLSNETHGSPRMTRKLQDEGLTVGRRRTARLIRENGQWPQGALEAALQTHHRQPPCLSDRA